MSSVGKFICILFTALIATSCSKSYYDMTPRQFESFINSCGKVHLIDVRTAKEYNAGHIKGAINIPVSDEIAFWDSIDSLQGKRLFAVYCHGGVRSSHAAILLSTQGGYTVYNLDGGIVKWKKQGRPIVKTTLSSNQDNIKR
ncbi:MAG: rhodanese-like domain-containing protein [Flavobacteriales bacterium]|nr:rhodanese-like domain-containing protein [Flavobacteriales bacterium]MBQ5814484.1 rhodanese-like domain-containing protein [Flavobacteriales bacterium]